MRRSSCTDVMLAGALAIFAVGCGGRGKNGGASGQIEFRGEQAFLPGLDVDTGWIPEQSPASVRATVTASGGVVVTALATSDGEALTPVAGSGEVAVDGALSFEVSARLDVSGIQYEGVVETFAYVIDRQAATFDPFALEEPVDVASVLAAQELGAVPIPSVPGSTLVLSVTGGEIETAFVGICAEATGGFGQYTGQTTISGTIACAATIEVDVPLVGAQTFGPFEFDVPIPEVVRDLDLGVRSLATGEPDEAMMVCGATPTDTSADTSADSSSDTSGASVGTTAMDTGTTSEGDDSGTSGTTGETGGTSWEGDPFYPLPNDGVCPPGHDAAPVISNFDNIVCLPECGPMQECPEGVTGNASPACQIIPNQGAVCFNDDDCAAGVSCVDNECTAAGPTHCVLYCDDAAPCPDAMECVLTLCTYPL